MLQPQSGQQAEEVLERMADAYYEVDGEWRVVYWNAAMAARTGYARDYVLGRSLWELFPMLVDTEFEENYRRAMAAREPVEFESSVAEADYRVAVAVYPTGDGLAVYSAETTERREHERRLAAVFDNAVQHMALLRPTGVLLEANDVLLDAMGVDAEDVRGHNIVDFEFPATWAEAHATLLDLLAVAAAGERAVGQLTVDGRVFDASLNPIESDDGEVVYVVLEVRDVTDQRRQRAELERERDLFHRVQEMAHIGAWELDLTTNEIVWTDEVYAIHGLSPETFTPTVETGIDFYHPEDRPVIEAAVERGVTLGEGWDEELRLVTATGDVIWVHAKGDVHYQNGEPATLRGTFQDITDRREREQRRQESEEQLRLVIDSVPQLVWLKNRDGRYLLANKAIAATYGTTPDELEGATDAEFAAADPERDFRADDRTVIDAGERVGFVEQVTDSAGDERTVQTQLLPFESVATGERLLLGITTDITERERTARELATSERYLRELYEISATSVPFAEKVSALLAIGCERFGLDLGILAHVEDDTYTVMNAHSTGDAIAEGAQFDLTETFCEVTVSAEEVVSFEQASCGIERCHPAYETFGVESYIGANVVVDGEPYGTVNFSSSVPRETAFSESERVYVSLLAEWLAYELEGERASRELERGRTQLRKIVDAVPHPISVKSRDGTYQLVNHATAAFFGRDIDEVEGCPESAFMSSGDRGRIAQADVTVIDSGQPMLIEVETVTDGTGDTRLFQSRKVPLADVETGETLVLGVSVDITDLKHSEAALRAANEELELRYSQLEFFDSLMRHDVLNALTVIRGNGEFIQEAATDDQTRQDAETIVEWSNDIVLLVNRIRDVIDVLTGDQTTAAPVELAPLVEAELSRLTAAYPHVTFDTTVDDVAVLGGDLLGEVVGNLLTNAVVHTDTEQPHVAVDVVADEETVQLVVADDGPGVADDRKAAVFRRGETSHVKHSGSGFGLFFVDTMVAAYGGTVRVEDNDPRGARFVLELPRHTTAAEQTETTTNVTETPQQTTVERTDR